MSRTDLLVRRGGRPHSHSHALAWNDTAMKSSGPTRNFAVLTRDADDQASGPPSWAPHLSREGTEHHAGWCSRVRATMPPHWGQPTRQTSVASCSTTEPAARGAD